MDQVRISRPAAGFTIIELVVVILLLGILAATALPRFIDTTDEAHTAAVDGLLGGLRTGVALFEAQWLAEGEPTDPLPEFNNLYPTSGGYPSGADSATIDANSECVQFFNGILQGGRPQVVSAADTVALPDGNTVASDATTTGTPTGESDLIEEAAEAGYSYIAFLQAAGTCDFLYLRDAGDLATPPTIRYAASSGAVTLQ
ncbi:MAG: type II secretion system protein [Pseudohongiellaceae bacterium]